ncbi:MAG: hypothetical protein H0U66_06580 [Gemmatimonadaceae bacterium]|nr:hypothetical protein [Gemmatimonadaceae bacterium]
MAGARKAGYSDTEIAQDVAQSQGFDIAGARKAGYSDNEIIDHLLPGSAASRAMAAGTQPNTDAAPTPGASESFGDHAVNGMSLNWLPKVDAAAHVMTDLATNAYKNAPDGQKIAAALKAFAYQPADADAALYNQRLAANSAYLQNEHDVHPMASNIGEVTGAVISPINKVAPVSPVLGGATMGATSALGQDDSGDLVHKALSATTGGVVGGAVGGIAGAALNRFVGGGSDKAAAILAPHISEVGDMSPALVPSGVLADVLPQLSRTVRSASPNAGAQIDAALLARRATQAPTIGAALEDALGVPRNSASSATADIIAQRAAAAKPLYEAAYQAKDISSPAVADAIKLPQFQRAYSEAQKLAQLEGKPLADIGADGTISVRGLDYLKRGLNNVIEVSTRGATMARSEARLLTSKLNGLLEIADKQAPEYATARQSFAGHSALADAAEAGGNFMKGSVSAEDVAADLKSLSPSEAATYRQTAANSILAKIEAARGSATGKTDLLAKVYDSIGGRAKLNALFPTPAAAARFSSEMDRLAGQNATQSIVAGGSNTVDKASALKQFEESSSPLGVLAKIAKTIEHPRQAFASASDAWVAAGAKAKVGARADAVAPMLVNPDASAVLQRIATETARRAKVNHLAGLASRNLGGAVVAPRMSSLVDSLLYGNRPGDVR